MRMLGRVHIPQCPVCRRPPGPDCPVTGDVSKKTARAREKRLWRRWG